MAARIEWKVKVVRGSSTLNRKQDRTAKLAQYRGHPHSLQRAELEEAEKIVIKDMPDLLWITRTRALQPGAWVRRPGLVEIVYSLVGNILYPSQQGVDLPRITGRPRQALWQGVGLSRTTGLPRRASRVAREANSLRKVNSPLCRDYPFFDR